MAFNSASVGVNGVNPLVCLEHMGVGSLSKYEGPEGCLKSPKFALGYYTQQRPH